MTIKGMAMYARGSKGFSLIELMIVVGVIAILAAIAYPNYRDYVINSRRAAASACLLEVGQFMERYHTTTLSYTDAVLPLGGCRDELQDFYTFALVVPDGNSYSVTGTRTARQPDARCGDISLNQLGALEASTGALDCF